MVPARIVLSQRCRLRNQARRVLLVRFMAIFESLLRRLGYVRLASFGYCLTSDGRIVPLFPDDATATIALTPSLPPAAPGPVTFTQGSDLPMPIAYPRAATPPPVPSTGAKPPPIPRPALHVPVT